MSASASTTISQELIPLSEPERWRAALMNVPHAFGHTWENCQAMHLTTGHPTNLYLWQRGEAKVVCPLAERLFLGATDVVTPYGFSGFVGTAPLPDFMDDWHRFAAQTGYVCGYIGLNPVLSNGLVLCRTEAFTSSRLYVMDLQLSVQALYQQLSQNRKRQLKGFAERQHLYAVEQEALKHFFMAQYHTFFSQKNAASTYNFSLPTLAYLLSIDEVVLVGYAEANEVKAVAVFAYTDYMGEYLFSVSLPGHEHHTTPLLWYGALQLKEKQVRYLNLGGGAKPGDSIAAFKQRFGALDLPLTALKQVYQQEQYVALCEQAGVDPAAKQGYFPPYLRAART
ncbi:hypothetical protein [Hymenobacter sp. B1770]|uniref:hypothetical protein n=1 Tax=Hymenobacter sp. B1770 TaxID=1718788 RepID=UPI003CF6B100